MNELDRFVDLNDQIQDPTAETPKVVERAKAIRRVLNTEPVEHVAREAGLGRRFLHIWVEAVQKDGFYGWLGKPEPKNDRVLRARGSIAQMLLGFLAEEHFEAVAAGVLGRQPDDEFRRAKGMQGRALLKPDTAGAATTTHRRGRGCVG